MLFLVSCIAFSKQCVSRGDNLFEWCSQRWGSMRRLDVYGCSCCISFLAWHWSHPLSYSDHPYIQHIRSKESKSSTYWIRIVLDKCCGINQWYTTCSNRRVSGSSSRIVSGSGLLDSRGLSNCCRLALLASCLAGPKIRWKAGVNYGAIVLLSVLFVVIVKMSGEASVLS